MKIAIYRGSFDPFTNGHLKIVEYIINKNIVDEIWIMPCFQSKYGKNLSDYDHRINMCKLAISIFDSDKIKVSDYENGIVDLDTFEILSKIKQDYNINDIYFIMGMDNAIRAPSWKNFKELKYLAKIIIIPRLGYNPYNYWFMNMPHIYLNEYIENDINSTEIRKNIKNHDLNNLMIDSKVLDYILKYELYV